MWSCKKEEPIPNEVINKTETYKKFTSENSPLIGVASDNLKCLEIDGDNNIWIGTRDAVGLLKYDPSNNSWVSYDSTHFGFDIWAILDIDFGLDGTLWIATNDGVFKHSDNNFSRVLIDSSGYPVSWVSTIHADHQGRIWASVNNDIYKCEDQNWVHLIQYDTLYNYQIQDIESDSQGNLWIGTFNGLIKFDGTTFELIDQQTITSQMNIHDINIDNEDELIIGCGEGLYIYYEPNWSVIEPTGFQQPLWDSYEWNVHSIVTNDTSKIYGTWNMGLAIHNQDELNFIRGSEFEIDTNYFQLTELKYDNQQNLWMGTRFGEVIVYNPSGLNF